MKNDDITHIGVGSVSLHVNRSARIWSEAIMYLSRTTRVIEDNYNMPMPMQVIVVYVIPGFQSPAEFSDARITLRSKKGTKRVQVEVAVPDKLFPENNPEEAKAVILDLMFDAVKKVETNVNRNRIIKDKLEGARNVIRKLWKEWDMSEFHYNIPEGLTYFDFPKVNEFTTRKFIEKLQNGGERHYNVLLDRHGKEVL